MSSGVAVERIQLLTSLTDKSDGASVPSNLAYKADGDAHLFSKGTLNPELYVVWIDVALQVTGQSADLDAQSARQLTL